LFVGLDLIEIAPWFLVDSEQDLLFNLHCLQKKSAKRRFRRSILDEWPVCAYCGCSDPMTLDHVTARSRGGKHIKSNLIGACADCNFSKTDAAWFEWFRSQEFWTLEREQKILNWINEPAHQPSTSSHYGWLGEGQPFRLKTA
jgi:hypothetical protein